MLKNELSVTQDQNKKQTDELNQLQEQIVVLKVEQATLQEKCRLALEEVGFGDLARVSGIQTGWS
jgi:cell division protein FtsB